MEEESTKVMGIVKFLEERATLPNAIMLIDKSKSKDLYKYFLYLKNPILRRQCVLSMNDKYLRKLVDKFPKYFKDD